MSIDYGFACFLHISYVFSVPLLIGIDLEPLTCCGCSNDTFGAQPFATTLLASFTLTNTGLRARNDQLEKFSHVIYYGLFKKKFPFLFPRRLASQKPELFVKFLKSYGAYFT